MRLLQGPKLAFRNNGHGREDDRAIPAALDAQSLSRVVLPERYLTALPDDLDVCSSYSRHLAAPSCHHASMRVLLVRFPAFSEVVALASRGYPEHRDAVNVPSHYRSIV